MFGLSGSLEVAKCKDLNDVTVSQLGVKERKYFKYIFEGSRRLLLFLRYFELFLPLLEQVIEV